MSEYVSEEMIPRTDMEIILHEVVERSKPKWISVDERLPERGEVIAYSTQYGDYLIGWLAETETEGVVCYGDGCMMYHVTHWMPLPDLPKEE